MAKKLLSIFAAVSMAVSAMANLTIVSAAGGLNVTDCNIANNAENVNTAAIVLTFDGNVTADDVLDAVTINGKSDNYNVEVKDNKAQLAIKGVTKNTNYTLNVKGSGNNTFTRNFMTGNYLYVSDMSQIGTNADRFTFGTDWHGKWYEMPASEKSENEIYMKFSDENILNYSLESAASEGILEISYDRYLPSYITDANGNPTETEAQFKGYGIKDELNFDNGDWTRYYTVNPQGQPKITKDAWHNYKYIINFDNGNVSFYIDGKSNGDWEWSQKPTGATYVKGLKLQVGGTLQNREQWIKNIKAVRKVEAGSWANHWAVKTDSNGVMTATTKNTSTYNYEQVKYNLKTPITSGRSKISFEVNANEVLADESKKESSNDIRLGTVANGDSGKTLYHPYTKPILDKWSSDGGKADLNLPEGVTKLAADQWHKYEMVVNVSTDGETTKRVVEYMTVDGASTICNSTDNGSQVACLIFTMPRVNNSELGDNVLMVRNVNVIENYSVGDLSATSNIPSDGVITPNEIKINFSSPITKESLNKLGVYNFDTDEEMDATFELDKTQQELTISMSQYDMNTEYQIRLKNVAGYLGGSLKNTNLNFTTPIKENITGKWTDKWWTNKGDTSITENQDGSVTIKSANNQQDYESSGNYQSSRNSFAYSFDKTVTGEDVPLTIKYSFKANEALTKSPSPVRLYGAEKTLGGCFNVSGAYNSIMYDDWYSYNKANKPAGVDSVTPNEWHTIEYAINVNSTSGSTLKYIIYDDVITYASTTGGKPMQNAALKGVQNIDFWFYSTSATTDNYELQVKDLSVTKGASSFDVTASNAELTTENNKIHLEFINPVNEADLKAGVQVVKGASVIENAISAYALSVDGRSADITIADIATGDYVLSFAKLSDVYGNTPETSNFAFNYTATAQEGVVTINSATAKEVTADSKDKVEVSIDLSNGKFSSVSGKLIAAAYDSENKLVGIGFVDATFTQETENQKATVTFDKPTAYTSVKVMLWDDFDTANALCASCDAALNSAAN